MPEDADGLTPEFVEAANLEAATPITVGARMDHITDEELATMKQRCASATPGPFVESRYADGSGRQWSSDCERQIVVCECFDEANREFHFHARTDVPRLIAELRAERAEVERLRREIDSGGTGETCCHGFAAKTPADWELLEAENVRLRERLAALEGKLT